MFGHGLIVGNLAPALAILSSDKTPLSSGPLNNEEVSWIGSINCIGGLLGSILFGYSTSVIGCKRSLFFVSFANIAFWVLTYYGSVYYQIFLARFTSGLSGEKTKCEFIQIVINTVHFSAGGIQTCAMLFISEIANNE